MCVRPLTSRVCTELLIVEAFRLSACEDYTLCMFCSSLMCPLMHAHFFIPWYRSESESSSCTLALICFPAPSTSCASGLFEWRLRAENGFQTVRSEKKITWKHTEQISLLDWAWHFSVLDLLCLNWRNQDLDECFVIIHYSTPQMSSRHIPHPHPLILWSTLFTIYQHL